MTLYKKQEKYYERLSTDISRISLPITQLQQNMKLYQQQFRLVPQVSETRVKNRPP